MLRSELNPELLSDIISHTAEAIVALDEQRTIRVFNPAAEKLLLFPAAAALGKSWEILIPPEERAFRGERLTQLFDRNHSLPQEDHTLYLNALRGDGSRLALTATYAWVGNPAHGLLTFFVSPQPQTADEEINQLRSEVNSLSRELHHQILRDPLTGLYNRRFLLEAIRREIALANREHNYVSLVLGNLDRFRLINESCGHTAGDQVLRDVAALLCEAVRASDYICRYSSDSYAVLLPGATLEMAQMRANQIRSVCQDAAFLSETTPIQITMSLGLAAFPDHGNTPEELTLQAELALERAKQEGRNRVSAVR